MRPARRRLRRVEVEAGEQRDDREALHGLAEVAADHRGEPVRLAVEGERGALDLLVVLEFDLVQPHDLDREAGGSGDADEGVRRPPRRPSRCRAGRSGFLPSRAGHRPSRRRRRTARRRSWSRAAGRPGRARCCAAGAGAGPGRRRRGTPRTTTIRARSRTAGCRASRVVPWSTSVPLVRGVRRPRPYPVASRVAGRWLRRSVAGAAGARSRPRSSTGRPSGRRRGRSPRRSTRGPRRSRRGSRRRPR